MFDKSADELREAGLFVGRGVLVDDMALGRLVERFVGLREERFGLAFLALRDKLFYLAQYKNDRIAALKVFEAATLRLPQGFFG